MPGTKEGGKKAAKTNKQRYGENFYKRIGPLGGKKSRGGGFAWMKENDPERLSKIGKKGGSKSSRSGWRKILG